MPFSDAWQANLTRLILGLSTAPAAPTPYLALFTVLPAADGTGGAQVDTATYGFGDPVDVSGDTYWDDPVDGEGLSELQADVAFGTPTSDPGPIVGCALRDGAAGDLITEAAEFDDPIDVVVGTPFVVPAGYVTFQST
jgi:hypothetical protein